MTADGRVDYLTTAKRKCTVCGSLAFDAEAKVMERQPRCVQMQTPLSLSGSSRPSVQIMIGRTLERSTIFGMSHGFSGAAQAKQLTELIQLRYEDRMQSLFSHWRLHIGYLMSVVGDPVWVTMSGAARTAMQTEREMLNKLVLLSTFACLIVF